MKFRNKKTGEVIEIGPNAMPTQTPSANLVPPKEKKSKKSFKESLLTGKTIPAVGATLGGITGGLLGGFPAVAGAGGGYAGGEAIRNLLAKLSGYGDITQLPTQQEAGETLAGSATAAALQGAGNIAAKGLSFAAHPLKRLSSWLDDLVAKSPKQVDVSNMAQNLISNVDELAANNPIKAQALREAAQSKAIELGSPAELDQALQPLSRINEIRKTTGGMGFGNDSVGMIDKEIAKVLNRLAREEVVGSVPGASANLGAQSALYTGQNMINRLPPWSVLMASLYQPMAGVPLALARFGRPAISAGLEGLAKLLPPSMVFGGSMRENK